MTHATGESRRSPGRPRDERADAAILRATVESIAEHGVAGTTMDAVAERAGVAKTTIYRRWDSKEALIVDAVRALSARVPPPDTGTLRGDLLAVLGDLSAVMRETPAGRVVPAIIGELPHNPALAEAFRSGFIAERRRMLAEVVRHARERGELVEEGQADLLPELLIGPMMVRLLVTGDPLDRAFTDRLVDCVLAALGQPQP